MGEDDLYPEPFGDPRQGPSRPGADAEDDDWAAYDPALADRLMNVEEIDRELEAAIEYKLATGEDAVGEILEMFARAVERRRLGLFDVDD